MLRILVCIVGLDVPRAQDFLAYKCRHLTSTLISALGLFVLYKRSFLFCLFCRCAQSIVHGIRGGHCTHSVSALLLVLFVARLHADKRPCFICRCALSTGRTSLSTSAGTAARSLSSSASARHTSATRATTTSSASPASRSPTSHTVLQVGTNKYKHVPKRTQVP